MKTNTTPEEVNVDIIEEMLEKLKTDIPSRLVSSEAGYADAFPKFSTETYVPYVRTMLKYLAKKIYEDVEREAKSRELEVPSFNGDEIYYGECKGRNDTSTHISTYARNKINSLSK